ncbi:MAG TPA: cytochrome c3 family protein [Gemmatimonadaceae bacterium]|nr:cytochrome c3 family protein [Gemmatimonadaceae bacterium]
MIPLRRFGPAVAIAMFFAGALFAAPRLSELAESRFPHEKHAKVFPLCTTCHEGVLDASASIWPDPVRCEGCHDGVVKKRISWQPRVGPRHGNRRFTHHAHDSAATARNIADSALIRNCSACHVKADAPRMAVNNAVIGQCLSCHGFKESHFDVPSRGCATCHLRLTDAKTLTREDIARFPKPRSHDAPDFIMGGHGKLARVTAGSPREQGISASCATCHARNLCLTCHVNAAESRVIGALSMDDRSPVFAFAQPTPASHRDPAWLRLHGKQAQRGTATCSTCHARESCATCHVGALPRAVAALPTSGPGRARGAQLVRARPSWHTFDFRERHKAEANARPKACETCHTRPMCLECHRPDVASQSRYHPANFVTRHPSSAYSREANCADCHNPAQFCQSCHQQSGLVATGRIGTAGYHDAFRGFSLGHGQAARQSLESCASCHAERDCTACHSAVSGGFRFSPHGPGFNAARMKSKNPSLCIACHGRAIPDVK